MNDWENTQLLIIVVLFCILPTVAAVGMLYLMMGRKS